MGPKPEIIRPKVGVAVIVWREEKFLIGKRLDTHGKGTWSVPGGHLEMGEAWEEAAARELMEETGLVGQNYRFLAATNDIFDSGKHYISIWMECDWSSGEVTLNEPDIMNEFQWCDFKTLPIPLFEPCWQNLRVAKPELFR